MCLRQDQRGFSLLEIMIVILIIGIGAATIRLAIVQEDPLEEVEKTANSFAFWFSNQLDIALLSNSESGLYFTEKSVATMQWRAGVEEDGENEIVWEVVNEVEYAAGFDSLDVELFLGLEALEWFELETEVPKDVEEITPHVLVFPSEEYSPSFQITFAQREYSEEVVTISGDGYNRLGVVREGR